MTHPLTKGLLGLALSALCVVANAHSSYRLTLIGDDPTDPSRRSFSVADINDKGEIVGAMSDGITPRAYLWRNGVATDIGDLLGRPDNYAEASSITNRTEIVGTSIGANGTFRPFIWRAGQMTDLGSFPDAAAAFAFSINSRREVLGESFDQNFDAVSFVQSGSLIRTLRPLPGGSGDYHAARINELGVAGGDSDSAGGRRAVIWVNDQPTDLGVLPRGSFSRFGGMNDLGHVVGFSSVNDLLRPFLWKSGVIKELPTLPGGNIWDVTTHGINNRGQIIGTEFRPLGEHIPLLWEDDEVVDLNNLVDPADPLRPYVRLLNGGEINNSGQIVVLGVDSRAPNFRTIPYLLTPITP